MCCHGDDADEKDPYENSMDWSAWRAGLSYSQHEPEKSAKKEWRKANRDPNYIPTNDRTFKIKQLMWEQPDISVEEIAQALGSPRTAYVGIAVIVHEHRHTLRFLVKQGIKGIEPGNIRRRVRLVCREQQRE